MGKYERLLDLIAFGRQDPDGFRALAELNRQVRAAHKEDDAMGVYGLLGSHYLSPMAPQSIRDYLQDAATAAALDVGPTGCG